MDHLRRLMDHMAWADRRLGDAFAAVPPGANVEKLLEVYAHVLGAEEVWLSRLEGRPARAAVWPQLGLEDCAKLARDLREGYATFLARLSPTDLARPIAYKSSAGVAFVSTIEDILLHVALHGSYHRGQIAARMREQGLEPAASDYIAFVRGAPAATRTSRP
jgi:uncharacterized damage-inducible protein DinB